VAQVHGQQNGAEEEPAEERPRRRPPAPLGAGGKKRELQKGPAGDEASRRQNRPRDKGSPGVGGGRVDEKQSRRDPRARSGQPGRAISAGSGRRETPRLHGGEESLPRESAAGRREQQSGPRSGFEEKESHSGESHRDDTS
jgi:hypothetical protein